MVASLKSSLTLAAAALMLAAFAGCGSTPSVPTGDERMRLDADVQQTINNMKTSPAYTRFANNAYAYAVFPRVTVAAIGIGGGHGRGEVYRGGQLTGYADVTKANVGAQLGAQEYAEIVFFQNEATYLDFTAGKLALDAKATAIAADQGAAATADYSKGVAVVTRPLGGLMAQAAVGGQKFRFIPLRDVGSAATMRADHDMRTTTRP